MSEIEEKIEPEGIAKGAMWMFVTHGPARLNLDPKNATHAYFRYVKPMLQ